MKRPNLSPIARFVSMNKLRMVRGYSYVSALAIPFLVAKDIAELVPSIPIWVPFVLGGLIIWVIGIIDIKKLWKYELEQTLTRNPEWIKKMEKQGVTDATV